MYLAVKEDIERLSRERMMDAGPLEAELSRHADISTPTTRREDLRQIILAFGELLTGEELPVDCYMLGGRSEHYNLMGMVINRLIRKTLRSLSDSDERSIKDRIKERLHSFGIDARRVYVFKSDEGVFYEGILRTRLDEGGTLRKDLSERLDGHGRPILKLLDYNEAYEKIKGLPYYTADTIFSEEEPKVYGKIRGHLEEEAAHMGEGFDLRRTNLAKYGGRNYTAYKKKVKEKLSEGRTYRSNLTVFHESLGDRVMKVLVLYEEESGKSRKVVRKVGIGRSVYGRFMGKENGDGSRVVEV